MDFDFSVEQKTLKEQGRRFLEQWGNPSSRRAVFEGEEPYNKKLWEKSAELGWLGAAIPEQFGGLGLGEVTLCAIAEELGRVLAPVPMASSVYLAAEALKLSGTAAQKQMLLPSIASAEQIATLALAERAGPIAASHMECRFADGVLNGTKIAVVDGLVADVAVVAARAGETVGLYVVSLSEAGVQRTPQKSIDPSRPVARLDFADAPAQPLDGWQGDGNVLDALLARAAVFVAFEQLGGAEAALELAKGYALERFAFGQPIGSFQAIKHKLAEVYVAIELARSQAYYAAWALESAASELPVAAAAARLAATAAFELAARELIQVHGGIGMTWEHDCHLYYRRSRHLALILGDSGQWREILMAGLMADSQSGSLT